MFDCVLWEEGLGIEINFELINFWLNSMYKDHEKILINYLH